MNLDENEQEIYSQLNGDKKTELDKLFSSTEFWNKLPKIAAACIGVFIVISYFV